MNEQPLYTRNYFTRHPEHLTIYVHDQDYDEVPQYDEILSEHSSEWFELYYKTASLYTPDYLPHQPDRLYGITVQPISTTDPAQPLLTVAGEYFYETTKGKGRATRSHPVGLNIVIPKHGPLLYGDIAHPERAIEPFSETLSYDIAHLMIDYFRKYRSIDG